MASAICFKCGAEKPGVLLACYDCGIAPRTNSEHAVSLALSDEVSSPLQLAKYGGELRNGLKLSVPRDSLLQALEALKDPSVRAILGLQSTAASTREIRPGQSTQPSEANSQRSAPDFRASESSSSPTLTLIHKSPFALLGANIRSNRREIVELAEEKSLQLDYESCQNARSDLTNPRTRLSAEIAWLPGVSPKRTSQLVDTLRDSPMAIRAQTGLPVLAQLNLLAATFEHVDFNLESVNLSEFIREFADLADKLAPDEVLRDINEDRSISGFPAVSNLSSIESELADRKRYYLKSIKRALDTLPPSMLVQTMTRAVQVATSGGEVHASELVDDLVDSYALEAHDFLEREALNIQQLVKATRDSAASGEGAVARIIDKLIGVVRNWDSVAQPIQLSAKARGIDHDQSHNIANSIRSLSVDLFNKHGMISQSKRLFDLIGEVFAELPEVVEQVEKDSDTLADISRCRKANSATDRQSPTYTASSSDSPISSRKRFFELAKLWTIPIAFLLFFFARAVINQSSDRNPKKNTEKVSTEEPMHCRPFTAKEANGWKNYPSGGLYHCVGTNGSYRNIAKPPPNATIETQNSGTQERNNPFLENAKEDKSLAELRNCVLVFKMPAVSKVERDPNDGKLKVSFERAGDSASENGVYKCEDANGKTVYRNLNDIRSPDDQSELSAAKVNSTKKYERPRASPMGTAWPKKPGYVLGYEKLNTKGYSKVTIDNVDNDSDVFVKLYFYYAKGAKPVRHIFIPAHGRFTMNSLSSGKYDVRYKELDSGSAQKSEAFVLEQREIKDGTQYSDISLTLYKVKDGNMQTYAISDQDF